jgi:hypothetical protein
MAAGPGFVGAAQAHAILGIGPDWLDIFGDNKKSALHHPRPDGEASAQTSRTTASLTTAGIAAAEAPTAKVGSLPENGDAREFAAAENVGIAESVGGGGGLSQAATSVRTGNLPRVSSAPVTRSIVIRGAPRSADNAARAVVSPAVPQAPVIVALAAPPPVAPEPVGRPAPAAPPAPSPSAPQAKDPLAPSDSGATPIPDSYRVGYAEYLRSATTDDLFMAALPGVAGIAGFTLVGAYAGYRQAKALQRALLAPVPTRILL